MEVRVYKNLHTGTLSMQTYIKGKGWRVHSHPMRVMLKDAKFLVYEAGRQRVLKEKRKNVHAYIQGTLQTKSPKKYPNRARYNPYKYSTWVGLGGEELTECSYISISSSSGVTFK
jgi:hypothetical protein